MNKNKKVGNSQILFEPPIQEGLVNLANLAKCPTCKKELNRPLAHTCGWIWCKECAIKRPISKCPSCHSVFKKKTEFAIREDLASSAESIKKLISTIGKCIYLETFSESLISFNSYFENIQKAPSTPGSTNKENVPIIDPEEIREDPNLKVNSKDEDLETSKTDARQVELVEEDKNVKTVRKLRNSKVKSQESKAIVDSSESKKTKPRSSTQNVSSQKRRVGRPSLKKDEKKELVSDTPTPDSDEIIKIVSSNSEDSKKSQGISSRSKSTQNDKSKNEEDTIEKDKTSEKSTSSEEMQPKEALPDVLSPIRKEVSVHFPTTPKEPYPFSDSIIESPKISQIGEEIEKVSKITTKENGGKSKKGGNDAIDLSELTFYSSDSDADPIPMSQNSSLKDLPESPLDLSFDTSLDLSSQNYIIEKEKRKRKCAFSPHKPLDLSTSKRMTTPTLSPFFLPVVPSPSVVVAKSKVVEFSSHDDSFNVPQLLADFQSKDEISKEKDQCVVKITTNDKSSIISKNKKQNEIKKLRMSQSSEKSDESSLKISKTRNQRAKTLNKKDSPLPLNKGVKIIDEKNGLKDSKNSPKPLTPDLEFARSYFSNRGVEMETQYEFEEPLNDEMVKILTCEQAKNHTPQQRRAKRKSPVGIPSAPQPKKLTFDSAFSTAKKIEEDKFKNPSTLPHITPVSTNNKNDSISEKVDEKRVNFVFCPTRLNRNQILGLSDLCKMCDGKISYEFNEEVTHLILNLEGRRVPQTMKYLFAIANKKWVLTFDWVLQCIKENKLVSEEPFETSNFPECDPGVKKSRLSTRPLFSNFKFYICGNMQCCSASVDECKKLLRAMGGEVVDELPNEPRCFSERILIVGDPLDNRAKKECQDLFDKYYWLSVSWEWVIDCVLTFTLVPFTSRHIISEVGHKLLSQVQIPLPLLSSFCTQAFPLNDNDD